MSTYVFYISTALRKILVYNCSLTALTWFEKKNGVLLNKSLFAYSRSLWDIKIN